MTSEFLAALFTGPLLRADAVFVCCGEDGAPRADVAMQLLRQQAAPVLVLSGGVQSAHQMGAEAMRTHLIGKGVRAGCVRVESASHHTRDQAVALVTLALAEGWHRLLLVASAYHLPRAFLTVVQALNESAAHETVQVVPVPPSQSSWFECPDGMTDTRMDLLARDLEKIDAYRAHRGHVATVQRGLDYLRFWEGQ